MPQFVKDEFDAFLECGILAHGFLRLRCTKYGHEKLVAFSCKRRGICPSCGARRMAETAAWLVEHVIPKVPVRQWVLSFPIPLRSLFRRGATARRQTASGSGRPTGSDPGAPGW
ncbi:MAG: transposase zinc-binding domain-containing protein [Burkholderiales bacterium]|nr:transposase zinc-binding domain-containing protein [Burkholderiales bacterium]